MTPAAVHTTTAAGPWDGFDTLLKTAAEQVGGARPREVVHRDKHSNDVAEVRFGGGRTLMVKRARHYPETAAQRFETARCAARILRERARVVAPEHLPLPPDEDGVPVEAYWRIPLPVLAELWPEIPAHRRAGVLRSWGELVGRMHAAPAAEAGVRRVTADRLREDLEGRLLPAIAWPWPAALPTAERLAAAIPKLAARMDARPPVLVHGDLHMGNVLCSRDDGEARCMGVVDLEEAFVAPAEAEWATMEVLHGPLFGQPLPEGWLAEARTGYARELDPVLLPFFRAVRLLNMGFHAAVTGLTDHAEDVARAAEREADSLRRLLRKVPLPGLQVVA